MENELKITRRNLPHWTMDGSIYFVTFRTSGIILNEEERQIVVDHIKEGDKKYYDCYAVIVMPDHIHLLIKPGQGFTLSRIMHGIKGVSAYKVNRSRKRRGAVWQKESYDRIVRDAREFDNELNYMYNNPIKKGLTEDPNDYVGWWDNYAW